MDMKQRFSLDLNLLRHYNLYPTLIHGHCEEGSLRRSNLRPNDEIASGAEQKRPRNDGKLFYV